MNKKYQNGNVIDHAFGLTKSTDAAPLTSYSSSTSSKSVPIMFETTSTTTTHSNFNFEDNFTESFNNNNQNTSIITNKLESITIVGDAPITAKNESLSSLSSNNTTNSFNSQQHQQKQQQQIIISNNKKSIASAKNEMSSGTASYSSQLTNSNTNPEELEEYDYEQEYDDAQLNIQTMRKVFNVFDSDQDGSITIEDVEIVMNSLQYLKNEIEMPSVDQIRIAFDKFDSNKNGSIEFDEFLNILKSANSQQTSSSNSIDDITTKTLPISTPPPPPPKSQPTTNKTIQSNPIINNNNNNKLNEISKATTNSYTNTNYNTFSNQKQQQHQSIVENSTDSNLKMNMKLIFEQFDKDNDGKITKNELNFVMSNLFPDEIITEQDIEIMLHAADLDKNGSIDFEEFANMFMLYSQNVNDVNASSDKIYQNSSSLSAKSNHITNNITRNSLKKLYLQQQQPQPLHLDLHERASLHSTKSNNLLKKNEITKSSKSLTRSIVSRSNSKESAVATANKQRSRTCSQTNTSTIINNQSPSNFRKVVQIFTTSQMMDLKAAFTMFDKNGDQKISESELLQVMKYLGLKTSESDVKAMIQVVDKNRNGYVDYDEFIQMMTQTQLKPLSAEEELRKTFNIFDIDGNGYISADEIKKTMAHLGENLTDEEVNDMIKAADKNGDGRIDLNEFSGLLNGQSGMSSGSSSGLKQSAK